MRQGSGEFKGSFKYYCGEKCGDEDEGGGGARKERGKRERVKSKTGRGRGGEGEGGDGRGGTVRGWQNMMSNDAGT